MKEVLFATSNESKMKRFEKKLQEKGIQLKSLKDIECNLEIEENGSDSIQNALIKARAYYHATGMITLAMDDSLFLEGVPEELQPGVYVRRVNSHRLSDEEMISHYSDLVKTYGENGKITAKWVYGMALIHDGKEYTYTWSKGDFYLVDIPSNKIKPGYPLNSISVNKKLNKYFTEITDEDKLLLIEDESDVIEFIMNSIENKE